MKQNEIEKIDLDVIHAMKTTVRQKTWVAVDAIKNIIQPYMTEKEAIKKANEYLVSQGVKKFWHKTHIRFGESTILSFNASLPTGKTITFDARGDCATVLYTGAAWVILSVNGAAIS